MKSSIAFLKERRQSVAARPRGRAVPANHGAAVPTGDRDHPEWPDPKNVVDVSQVRMTAQTRQRSQLESRGDNKRYHLRQARQCSRQFIAAARAVAEGLEKQIGTVGQRLQERLRQKKELDRFGHRKGRKKTKDKKKPCTRWIQALFGTVVVVMLIAILNGTLSVSSVMLDSTAFSGAYAKTITIALGFFLLPGLGLSIPFHLLKPYRSWAYRYLALLVGSGILCGFFFAVTWAHTYAVETGNQTLIDLTMIGLNSDDALEKPRPWLWENANWLSLLFQILADMCFTGAAKSYLSYLSWNYHLFRDKAFQQDPEWLALDREVRELGGELTNLETEKRRAEERLADLETEAEEFAEAVVACADALFLQEIDRFERDEERIRNKEAELREKEAAWRQSQQELSVLLEETPGIARKGDSHA